MTLTYKEFELLVMFLKSGDVVLTRDRLLNEIWGYSFDGENRTVDVHIRTLRQKLGPAGELIETVRGVGYKLGGKAIETKIFKHIFLVAMVVFVSCIALTLCSLYSYFSAEHNAEIRDEASYVAAAVEENGIDFLRHRQTTSTTRVTWIDTDGTVLYDSVADPDEMGNHKNREEVQQALTEGVGESSRYSDTLSEKTTNYAIRLKDGTVIRVSGTQYTAVTLIVGMFYSMVAVLLLAILLSVILPPECPKA